jgi:hypothetical protein
VPLLTPFVGGAALLAGFGILFGFIGLVVTSASNSNKVSGATLTGFGVVLAALAVALIVLDQAPRKPKSELGNLGIFVGAGLAAVTLLFSLIGLVKAFSTGAESFDGYWAWMPFGTTFAFICVGWLYLMRPAAAIVARIFTAATAGMSFILALVGLATGLGSGFSYPAFYPAHGLAWLSWALVWAVVAIAGGLSRRTD